MFSVPFVLALVASVALSPVAALDKAVTDDEPAVVKIVKIEDGQAEVKVGTPTVQCRDIYVTAQDGVPQVQTIVVDGKNATISNDGQGAIKVVLASGKDGELRDIDVGGPWLGVQFGPVSKPLQSQLRLENGVGQMVLNVVNDSPADVASLEQYDVIVAMNGVEVTNKIGDFLKMAREFSPGQTITIDLIRGGQPLTQSLVVGERPEKMGSNKYKYDIAIEELNDGGEFFRGGLLQQNDDGSWSIKDLDADSVLDVWSSMPDGAFFSSGNTPSLFSFGAQPGALPTVQGKTFVWQQADAQSIRIERADDGTITVVRTEKDGDGNETTTTKTYASEDELKAEDPEAADFVSGHSLGAFYTSGGSLGHMPFMQPGGLNSLFLQLDKDCGTMGLDIVKLQDQIREAMEGADVAVKLGDVHGQMKPLDQVLDQIEIISKQGQASVSFKLTQDGKIQVTTRQGDEELTQLFDSAQDMKTSNPELFRKYTTLHRGHDRTPSVEPK